MCFSQVLRVNDLHGSQHFILFGSEKVIGIQLFPPDGNPYKFVGMIGHPVKVNRQIILVDTSKNRFLKTDIHRGASNPTFEF